MLPSRRMAFDAGTTLGAYQLLAPIGAGGMGEVYRARDTRLDRDVAIKVLPPAFAADASRRERFEREAKAIAALSHPNIVAIHDTGLHDAQVFIVMELLQGQTLRDALQDGGLPLRKAIDIAVLVARGLAAAHDKGLVHRDLKPENVFILTDGQVKILDFGLARPVEAGSGATETQAAITDPGTVVGTAGYMAPEQVRGLAVDARTDLFALGAVLYEMLGGRPAFRGDTPADTMFAVVKEDPPDLSTVRAAIPPALERIVRHCLEKNPAERFQSARDVAFALEALSGSGTSTNIPDVSGTVAAPPPRWSIAGFAAGAVVAGVIAAGWAMVSGPAPSATVCAAGLEPSAIGTMAAATSGESIEIHPALSPDGKLLAYAAGTAQRMRVYLRPVGGGRVIQLSDATNAYEYQPRWSPDGTQILFLTRSDVRVVASLGGASRRIAAGPASSAAWSPDGSRIVLARGAELAIVRLDGGEDIRLGRFRSILSECDWSGDRIACAFGNPNWVRPGPAFGNLGTSGLVVVPASGGEFAEVVPARGLNTSPVWGRDGRTLYFVSNEHGLRDVYTLDVPPDGQIASEPCRVSMGLGVHSIAISSGGQRLAYVAFETLANIWSVPIPSTGIVDASSATPVTAGNQIVEGLQVSRDGQWLVYDSTLFGNSQIFRVPVAGGPAERLTINSGDDFNADLSPDGKHVIFHSNRFGNRDVFLQAIDGGPAQPLTNTGLEHQESYPLWSPDGNALMFRDQRGNVPLFVMRRTASGEWSTPVPVPGATGSGSWLPDGRSVVSASDGAVSVVGIDGSARRLLYAPAPESTDPQAESVVASADGRTVYFKSHDRDGVASIWSVSIAGGRPRQLVRFGPAQASIRRDFAAGAGRLYFTLEDRQASIMVADLIRPAR